MVKSSFESTKEVGQLSLVPDPRRAASGSNVMLCKNQGGICVLLFLPNAYLDKE